MLYHTISGIPADVWTAEKLPENPDDPYSTIEIFFADQEYTVQIGINTNIWSCKTGTSFPEEVNELKNVPLGMVTHHASSITAANFHSKVISSIHSVISFISMKS